MKIENLTVNQQETEYAIYVHLPFCKARCNYCAFSSCVDFSLLDAYFSTLEWEIARTEVPNGICVKRMFWGGGTPSALPISYLEKLHNALLLKFDLGQMDEFTVECNPESVTAELLNFLREIGVNRLSFGLQSANNSTLKKINRLHTFEEFLRAIDCAQKCGFDNINADLILGLPETRREFEHSAITVTHLPLQHISLYALEIHDGAPIRKLCEKWAFSDDQLADMYDFAREQFFKNGFLRYEVSNFAKEGWICKHNLMYWKVQHYFAFGASASGYVGDMRFGNAFDIKDYIASDGNARDYSQIISKDERLNEFLMLGLRLQNGISVDEFSVRFGCDFFEKCTNARNLIEKGFLSESGGRVRVADDKFYVLNSILTELLPD